MRRQSNQPVVEPPQSYFNTIKQYSDWKSADISDMGYKMWGASFPSSWAIHKKLAKQKERNGKS